MRTLRYVTTESGAMYAICRGPSGQMYVMRASLGGDEDLTFKNNQYHPVANVLNVEVGRSMMIEWTDGRVRCTSHVTNIEEVPTDE